jgi:hypothetical protein
LLQYAAAAFIGIFAALLLLITPERAQQATANTIEPATVAAAVADTLTTDTTTATASEPATAPAAVVWLHQNEHNRRPRPHQNPPPLPPMMRRPDHQNPAQIDRTTPRPTDNEEQRQPIDTSRRPSYIYIIRCKNHQPTATSERKKYIIFARLSRFICKYLLI